MKALWYLFVPILLLSSCYESPTDDSDPNKQPSTHGTETPEGDPILVQQLPQAPCYLANRWLVVDATLQDNTHATALLLSTTEWYDIPSAYAATDSDRAQTLADSYSEHDVTGWHIPTLAQANRLKELYAAEQTESFNLLLADHRLPTLNIADRYLCDQGLHTFSFNAGSTSNTKAGAKTLYSLRLVKTVQFQKSESGWLVDEFGY